VQAWLGLARVSRDEEEREAALQRVLALEPENDAARKLLRDGQVAPDGRAREESTDGDDSFSQPRPRLQEADAVPAERDGTAPVNRPPVESRSAGTAAPVAGERAAAPDAVAAEALAAAGADEIMFCYRHPQRATGLRCITCNRPICISCAKHTPVGYRCPQCIRQAQDVFYSANVLDYAITGVVALILSLVAGLIAPRLGFFVIFIGPAAGTLIGRLAFRVARRRHGRYLPQLVAAMVAIGGLLPAIPGLLLGGPSLLGLIWPLVYVFLATGAAYYQVK
jgi:hypothetical protein